MSGMPASTKKGGTCLGVPDVCKTPVGPTPVPIPYPNTAKLSSCDGTIDKVLMQNKETVVESSKIPSSSGDEAGTLKGVVSSKTRGEVQFKKYSSKVYAKGKKIVHHTARTSHNGSNANMPAGVQMVPSQTAIIVAS